MMRSSEFTLPGGRDGVLLVHGLTGTPAEMRFVGNGLNRAGYTVRGVQLAGHCGDESDLLATGWQDWYASVVVAAHRMRTNVDHLFVAGLSMGALLALELAIDDPDLVDGIGLYGTTFFHDGWATPWQGRFAPLLPLAKQLGIGRNACTRERPPYGIKDERIRRRIADAMAAGDSAGAGLAGFPWHALAELQLLSRHVRRRLNRVRTSCLIVHSSHDDVASLRNVALIERHVAAPVETLLLDDSYHMVTLDRQRGLLIDRSARFFRHVLALRSWQVSPVSSLTAAFE